MSVIVGMVALRVLGGLKVAEVARIVGKRPGTVRVLAHRACGAWPNGWRRGGWHGV